MLKHNLLAAFVNNPISQAAYLVVALTIASSGCRSGNDCAPLNDQESPQTVCRKMYHSAMDANQSAFAECFHDSQKYRDFVIADFGMLCEYFCFKRALRDHYGDEAVDYFENRATMKEPGAANFKIPPLDRESLWWEKLECTIEGKSAKCYDPYTKQVWNLIQSDGVWQIDLSTVKSDMSRLTRMLNALKAGAEKTRASIGKPGVSIDDIRRILGANI